MPRSPGKPVASAKRKANYRQRMRSAGLRAVQIRDTGARGFVAKCRRQARSVAANDPAGGELMRFADAVREWPSR